MYANRFVLTVDFNMGVEARHGVYPGFIAYRKAGILEKHTIDLWLLLDTISARVSMLTHIQKGYPRFAPRTLVGIPNASRIADKSWLPKPPRIRHMIVEDFVIGTPHSDSRACLTSSVARVVLSSISSGLMSVNLFGKVPDWETKALLGPMMSWDRSV